MLMVLIKPDMMYWIEHQLHCSLNWFHLFISIYFTDIKSSFKKRELAKVDAIQYPNSSS